MSRNSTGVTEMQEKDTKHCFVCKGKMIQAISRVIDGHRVCGIQCARLYVKARDGAKRHLQTV